MLRSSRGQRALLAIRVIVLMGSVASRVLAELFPDCPEDACACG